MWLATVHILLQGTTVQVHTVTHWLSWKHKHNAIITHQSKMDLSYITFYQNGAERGRERGVPIQWPPPPTCLVTTQLRGHLGTNCQQSPTRPHSQSLEQRQYTTIDKIPASSQEKKGINIRHLDWCKHGAPELVGNRLWNETHVLPMSVRYRSFASGTYPQSSRVTRQTTTTELHHDLNRYYLLRSTK